MKEGVCREKGSWMGDGEEGRDKPGKTSGHGEWFDLYPKTMGNHEREIVFLNIPATSWSRKSLDFGKTLSRPLV